MPEVETDTVGWQSDLNASGARRERTLSRLHAFLLRAARREVRRQAGYGPSFSGVEIDDLTYQVADDSLMAILGKIEEFRGESRFTTWAYSFVVLDVAAKLRRHIWRQPTTPVPMPAEVWDAMPDKPGTEPADYAEQQGLMATVHRAVETQLSRRQRQVFVAVVLRGVPVDEVGTQLGVNRNAIHQTMFAVRHKLRCALQADGYLPAAR